MPYTTYTRNKILDHVNGKTSYTMPSIWVGLSSTTPAADGSNVTEPSTGSYARVATVGADWNAAAAGSSTNANAITFPTASADWVSGADLTYGVLFDAVTAGNVIGYGVLSVAKDCLNGDTMVIGAGQLAVAMS